MVLFYKGFGRWANNSFLSFIGDTIFPFPFYQKIDDSYAENAKKMSWRRRVDINMAFYIFLLIMLIAIEIFYNTLLVSVQQTLFEKMFVLSLCKLKANVSQEILNWHSLRHSHSADICIHFYCLS